LHGQVRRLRGRLGDGGRPRDVLEVDARRVQRSVPQELLDRVEDVPLWTWASAHPCRRPCGWTRFSMPAFAASRLQSARHREADGRPRLREAQAPPAGLASRSVLEALQMQQGQGAVPLATLKDKAVDVVYE
jgi:hypothetical protein